jgi:acetyltransferase
MEATALLEWTDIAEAAIRPIRTADFPLLLAFVRGLSRDTGYKRLMSPRTPPDDEIRRWCEIDRERECALVATAEGRIVGVARYGLESAVEADFAIVLADAWQGRGLGRELLQRLIAAARLNGVHRLVGSTLTENTGMLKLAAGLGFVRRRAPRAAFATLLALDLQPLA